MTSWLLAAAGGAARTRCAAAGRELQTQSATTPLLLGIGGMVAAVYDATNGWPRS